MLDSDSATEVEQGGVETLLLHPRLRAVPRHGRGRSLRAAQPPRSGSCLCSGWSWLSFLSLSLVAGEIGDAYAVIVGGTHADKTRVVVAMERGRPTSVGVPFNALVCPSIRAGST